MKSSIFLLLCGLVTLSAGVSQAQPSVTLSGFVTRVSSSSDFDVNAIHIRCGAKTEFHPLSGRKTRGCPQELPYVGEPIQVHGELESGPGGRSVEAAGIYIKSEHEADTSGSAPEDDISGSALIDALPPPQPSTPTGSLLVRADGYRILITGGGTNVHWSALHGSLTDVQVGDWITYKGAMRADGVVVAEDAKFSQITVGRKERKYRGKSDYDPSKVPATAHQSALHQVFVGIDYKRIPPYEDPKLQAQLTAIGDKLIPAFQRDMPENDPAKINFRFQLTNDPKWHDVAPLPSGVILIPYKAVERMQSDSQLAALLADGVARALERSQYRMHGRVEKTAIGAFLVFSPEVAAGIAAETRHVANQKELDQSGRVSLGLLHDAGYDIDQAPIAWWLLAAKDPKPISEIPLPTRAANLYRILGEEWQNPAAAAEVTH